VTGQFKRERKDSLISYSSLSSSSGKVRLLSDCTTCGSVSPFIHVKTCVLIPVHKSPLEEYKSSNSFPAALERQLVSFLRVCCCHFVQQISLPKLALPLLLESISRGVIH